MRQIAIDTVVAEGYGTELDQNVQQVTEIIAGKRDLFLRPNHGLSLRRNFL